MKWKLSPKKSDDIIEQLLMNRGMESNKDKLQFFNPKISDYKKDIEIPNIEKAQKRIFQAVKNNELIIVYGDYDVDGICASAILYKALSSFGAKVLPYIPHREKEGYGLSKLGLEFARDAGASVVVTVDNGIVAFRQAEFAKELGLDLIITDHHLLMDKKPEAYTIVHSTKMCGASVAWCLIQKIIKKDLAQELLQFVAIATICDLIPLVGLGRGFVYRGLKILNRTANLGLLALINESGISLGNIGPYEIGFMLGPRLNAIGRLEHAIDALRLLCTKDSTKARNLAKLLNDTNATRQKMTASALEEAKLLIDTSKKVHVLSSKDWSMGIIGLIAGKISDQYYRPAIAISLGEKVSKGSARSIDGVNIVEVIRNFGDILIDVGGHPGAAGFSIETKYVEIFKARLEKHLDNLPQQIEQALDIDAEVETNQLTKSLVYNLQKFAPFGFGNPKPVFVTSGMQVSDIRTVGEGKHLKFKVDGLDAIAFGMGKLQTMLTNGQMVDVVYTPEIDTYNSFEKIQLKVKDFVVK